MDLTTIRTLIQQPHPQPGDTHEKPATDQELHLAYCSSLAIVTAKNWLEDTHLRFRATLTCKHHQEPVTFSYSRQLLTPGLTAGLTLGLTSSPMSGNDQDP